MVGPKVAPHAISASVWSDAFCHTVTPLAPFRNLTDTSPGAGAKLALQLQAAVQPVSSAVLAFAPLGYPNITGGRELAQETITNYAQAPFMARTPVANPSQLDTVQRRVPARIGISRAGSIVPADSVHTDRDGGRGRVAKDRAAGPLMRRCRLTVRAAVVVPGAVAALGACSSSGSSGPPPTTTPKIANVKMSIDQSLVEYTTAHGTSAFVAKARTVCEQQKVDRGEPHRRACVGGPTATFSYDCKKL